MKAKLDREAMAQVNAINALLKAQKVIQVAKPDSDLKVRVGNYGGAVGAYIPDENAIELSAHALVAFPESVYKGLATHEAAHADKQDDLFAVGRAIARLPSDEAQFLALIHNTVSDYAHERALTCRVPGFQTYLDQAHAYYELRPKNEPSERAIDGALKGLYCELFGIPYDKETAKAKRWAKQLKRLWDKNPEPLPFALEALEMFRKHIDSYRRPKKNEGGNGEGEGEGEKAPIKLQNPTPQPKKPDMLSLNNAEHAIALEIHNIESKADLINTTADMLIDDSKPTKQPKSGLGAGTGKNSPMYPPSSDLEAELMTHVNRHWRGIVKAFDFLRKPQTLLNGGRKSGRFYRRTAHKIATGNNGAFATRETVDNDPFDLDIYFDVSGSMTDRERANAFILLKSLAIGKRRKLLPRLNLRTFVFSSRADDPRPILDENMILSDRGNTYLAPMLRKISQTKPRNIIIYSDLWGQHYEIEALPVMVTYLKAHGHTMTAIVPEDPGSERTAHEAGFDFVFTVNPARLVVQIKEVARRLYKGG